MSPSVVHAWKWSFTPLWIWRPCMKKCFHNCKTQLEWFFCFLLSTLLLAHTHTHPSSHNSPQSTIILIIYSLPTWRGHHLQHPPQALTWKMNCSFLATDATWLSKFSPAPFLLWLFCLSLQPMNDTLIILINLESSCTIYLWQPLIMEQGDVLNYETVSELTIRSN